MQLPLASDNQWAWLTVELRHTLQTGQPIWVTHQLKCSRFWLDLVLFHVFDEARACVTRNKKTEDDEFDDQINNSLRHIS